MDWRAGGLEGGWTGGRVDWRAGGSHAVFSSALLIGFCEGAVTASMAGGSAGGDVSLSCRREAFLRRLFEFCIASQTRIAEFITSSLAGESSAPKR